MTDHDDQPRTAVFLNGILYDDPEDARLSAFDAGLQHSVGLFETMLGGHERSSAQPWIFRLDEHIDRLCASAATLGLADSLNSPALQQAVMRTLSHSGLQRSRIRLTLTGGDLNLLARDAAERSRGVDPTVLIVAQPATRYPSAMIEKGVMATIADTRANPFNPSEGHKTLNYWWRLRELQLASRKGAAESIVLTITNHLCSGCVSNVFVVKDGSVLTPIARGEEGQAEAEGADEQTAAAGVPAQRPAESAAARPGYLPSPVLPGVTRAWVRHRCELKNAAMKTRMLGVADLLEADEVFLTNSSWGVLPIVNVERATIGTGEPGPITRELCRAWLEATDDAL